MTARTFDPVRKAAEGITPESAGWDYLGFKTVHLEVGVTLAAVTGSNETALVWLGGRAEVPGFGTIGGRADVWDGKPHALVLPPGTEYEIRTETGCDLAIVSAPAQSELPPRLIRPDDVRIEIRGSGVTERRIHWVVAEQDPAARLILVEVFTPAGHWSTFPPHKHDTDDPPRERALEEIYYYRIRPEQGFAFQAIYTADRSLDMALRPRHGDLVLVPRGYHVVSAAPGYECYYLNAMAGAVREWRFTTDPDHAWLLPNPPPPQGVGVLPD